MSERHFDDECYYCGVRVSEPHRQSCLGLRRNAVVDIGDLTSPLPDSPPLSPTEMLRNHHTTLHPDRPWGPEHPFFPTAQEDPWTRDPPLPGERPTPFHHEDRARDHQHPGWSPVPSSPPSPRARKDDHVIRIITYWGHLTTLSQIIESPFYTFIKIPANPSRKTSATSASRDHPTLLHAVHPIPKRYLKRISSPKLRYLAGYLNKFIIGDTLFYYGGSQAKSQEMLDRVSDTILRIDRVLEKRLDENTLGEDPSDIWGQRGISPLPESPTRWDTPEPRAVPHSFYDDPFPAHRPDVFSPPPPSTFHPRDPEPSHHPRPHIHHPRPTPHGFSATYEPIPREELTRSPPPRYMDPIRSRAAEPWREYSDAFKTQFEAFFEELMVKVGRAIEIEERRRSFEHDLRGRD